MCQTVGLHGEDGAGGQKPYSQGVSRLAGEAQQWALRHRLGHAGRKHRGHGRQEMGTWPSLGWGQLLGRKLSGLNPGGGSGGGQGERASGENSPEVGKRKPRLGNTDLLHHWGQRGKSLG